MPAGDTSQESEAPVHEPLWSDFFLLPQSSEDQELKGVFAYLGSFLKVSAQLRDC